MAEITAQDLYNQLTPLEKQQYDGVMGMGGFKQRYEENPTSQFVLGDANYAKFKAVADAEKAVPEKSLFSVFSSASAAEPDRISSVSGTPGFETIVNPDGTIQIVPVDNSTNYPFRSMVDMAEDINNFSPINTDTSSNNFVAPVPPVSASTMFQDLYYPNLGIMNQAPKSLGFDTSFGVANEPDDEEDVDKATETKSGIAKLFEFLQGVPTPFNLIRGGLESLSGLNQRIQGSDFGRSRTLMEFLQKRRERKQAERAQKAMPDVYKSARDQGFTNDRGGFSTDRADDAGTSVGSGQFSPRTSRGRAGY